MNDTLVSPVRDAPWVRRRLEPWVAIAVLGASTAIVIAASAVASDGTVPGWEAAPLRWIVSWPDWFEPAMWALQQAGVLVAPILAGLVVVWRTRRWWYLLPFTLILPLKLALEKAVVKQLVDRQRPATSLGSDIEVRGPQLVGAAFPSGHCTTAAAVAVLLVAFLPPKWRPVPVAWAGAVAVARLYYGEHNVLDVVAGTALGTAFAVLLWFAFLNRDAPERRVS